MIDLMIVMGIRMQNHKCNEVENAIPILRFWDPLWGT